MRTFKQFLVESKASTGSFLIEDNNNSEIIIQWIKENCSEWLQAAHGKWFYRGIKLNEDKNGLDFIPDDLKDKLTGDITGSIWYGHTRKNRFPVDSSQQLHDAHDKVSQKKLGIDLRSNCLFVTKSKTIASRYGKTFVVFPVGKIQYAYPKLWDDAYVSLKSAYSLQQGITTEYGQPGFRPRDAFLTWIDSKPMLVKAALKDAADHDYETTVDDVKKYVTGYNGEFATSRAIERFLIPKWIETTPSLFEWNKNLNKARISTEIMVYCDNYLAVDMHYAMQFLTSLGEP